MAKTFRAPRLLTSACLTAAFAVAASGQSKFVSSGKSSEQAALKSYVARVDAYVTAHARDAHLLANVAGKDGQDNWQELKSLDVLLKPTQANESALAWLRRGHVVLARFTLQSDSGDWVHYVDYYFRNDGTLAKVETRLNTFYGHVTAVREKFYGERGEMLQSDEHFYRLGTKHRLRSKDGKEKFIDEPVPVYKTARELPFYRLLK
ncbi:MAG TPA: hypothetical protein VLJ61_06285 [Pyrinomonadaceae bacterium]|nr:hypothetical protein [Pyrinomonadaceae bacterium]